MSEKISLDSSDYEKNIRTYGITRVIRFATHSVRSHN